MTGRHQTPVDRLINHIDSALRTVFSEPSGSGRSSPAEPVENPNLSATEKAESICLMRVNHAGEVCAQALYQGQALTAREKHTREQMKLASEEENDHLRWCKKRIDELGGQTSLLNPLWYSGSFAIGAISGLLGDKWSLGFLAETEHQVVKHLEGHLQRLPEHDSRSHAILEQMKVDEAHHETTAVNAGGEKLPDPAKKMMTLMSRVMTTTAYRL